MELESFSRCTSSVIDSNSRYPSAVKLEVAVNWEDDDITDTDFLSLTTTINITDQLLSSDQEVIEELRVTHI